MELSVIEEDAVTPDHFLNHQFVVAEAEVEATAGAEVTGMNEPLMFCATLIIFTCSEMV